jgi:hypothetical protein
VEGIVADKDKKDPFEGYKWADYDENVYSGKRRASGAKGAEFAFSRDKEGMKSDYDKFKQPSDPDSETLAKRLGKGDVKALDLMKQAHKRSDNYKAAMENQKQYGMKKGGKVKSASARADGIAIRGKTRA